MMFRVAVIYPCLLDWGISVYCRASIIKKDISFFAARQKIRRIYRFCCMTKDTEDISFFATRQKIRRIYRFVAMRQMIQAAYQVVVRQQLSIGKK